MSPFCSANNGSFISFLSSYSNFQDQIDDEINDKFHVNKTVFYCSSKIERLGRLDFLVKIVFLVLSKPT